MPRPLARPALLLLLAGTFSPAVHGAEPTRLEVTRDTWISAYPTETEGNNGGSPKLKLKGVQELILLDLDPARLAGRRIVRAELRLHLEGKESLGRVTVSSVADEWIEGGGTSYAKTPGAACFGWARLGEQRWAGHGADVTAAINGAGGSVWGFGDASAVVDGWQSIPVDPRVLEARAEGRSHGFAVMDDVGSEYTKDGNRFLYRPFPNRYFSSREGKRANAPHFLVWFEPGTPAPPAPAVVDVARPPAPAGRLPEGAGPNLTPATIGATDEWGETMTTLDLFAAKGEALGFLLEESPDQIAIDLPFRRYAAPKVGPHLDPLRPDERGVFVEFQIPKNARAGRHAGQLTLRGRTIPFSVTVWNFTLPDRLSFLAQMNGYGLPGQEHAYYRLAHEHRATLNILPYGWSGKTKLAPKVRPDGSFDWRSWDAQVGPLLDGSAFADLPRGRVPVEAFYLPLNENWPMDHEKSFRGGYWIEDAYDEAYWSAFRQAVGAFARHFAERGWTESMGEFYLNNKVTFKQQRGGRWEVTTAPWVFDEPSNTQDFWALRRFGQEFWRAAAEVPAARLTFRCDISRPQWQRDLLDGITGVEVLSGSLRTYEGMVRARAARDRKLIYMYGSANKLGTSRSTNVAWCVETWARGADGVVPWQTIGKADAWTQPDDLALLYPGPDGPRPSLRLKSFRAGQQLVEYLTQYVALSGQDRAAVGAAVLALPGLQARTLKRSEDDAGDSAFGAESARALARLRLELGAWLDAQAPAPRERWHDPRPPGLDPAKIPVIVPLPTPPTR